MGHHGDLALNDIIRYMLSQSLDFTPGLKYQYCNLCYSVLGQIIEAVSGKEYRSYIQDTILTPLGMWHTRIGPHHSSRQIYGSQPNLIPTLKFEDGYILLGNDSINSGVNYALLDSTLGWYSNVYDMMRLMKGIEDIIKPETLELMLGKPFIFEHSDTWHGIGFRIHNHNTWWQTADSHDNELVLYHQNGGSSGTGRHKHSPKQRLSWVIFLNGNQRKNVHKLTADIVNSVEQWPSDDHFIDDCSDSLHELKDGKLVLMKYRLPEHHLQAYGIALANYQYYPIWISGYTVQDRTYFSIICQQDPKTDHLHVLYKLFYDLDS
uniref:Uncharacterized protein LOC102806986 n=1 Tax=Saccoglossus kowalevskii TaxID=10224 RepID=A0ABM0M5V8_SACKO|nr:PREDICTED: uncharacterized protein LOC102806986 [Saccoglossus kowalevskii]